MEANVGQEMIGEELLVRVRCLIDIAVTNMPEVEDMLDGHKDMD